MLRSTKPLVLCLQAGLRLAENVKASPLLSRGSGATDVPIIHTRLGGASRGLQTKLGFSPPLASSWHQGTPRWVACGVPVSNGGGGMTPNSFIARLVFWDLRLFPSMGEAVVFGGIGHMGEVCDCALGPQETSKSTGVEARGHSTARSIRNS